MDELPEKKPVLLPPAPGTPEILQPGTMGPAPKAARQRKGKRRKDGRRRTPTGKPRGSEPKLTPVHVDQLRDALRSGWTPYSARKHFAPLWGVSETLIRNGTDQILAEMAQAREGVSVEQRAASVLEGMWRHVRFCYDAYESTGDSKVLSGVHATLANIAKIEAAAPFKVQVNGDPNGAPIAVSHGQMSPEQIKARIAELAAKHGFGGTPKK